MLDLPVIGGEYEDILRELRPSLLPDRALHKVALHQDREIVAGINLWRGCQ
jgi:hypothetical protein